MLTEWWLSKGSADVSYYSLPILSQRSAKMLWRNWEKVSFRHYEIKKLNNMRILQLQNPTIKKFNHLCPSNLQYSRLNHSKVSAFWTYVYLCFERMKFGFSTDSICFILFPNSRTPGSHLSLFIHLQFWIHFQLTCISLKLVRGKKVTAWVIST